MFEDKNSISASHSDSLDGFSVDTPEKRLDQIKTLLQATQHGLDKITRIVDKIQQDQKKEMYKNMPGVEGSFDGFNLIADDGSKHEVPANYAAKSRLVFGDRLKIVEEDGKKVFKQISKLDRKEVKGILSKKEGKWYLLADSGTYKISDVAAEFNKAELKDEAVGLVPENQLNAPFAALDLVIKKDMPKVEIATAPAVSKAVSKPKEIVAPKKVEPVKTEPAKVQVETKTQPEKKVEHPLPAKIAPKPLVKKEPFIRPVGERKVSKKPAESVEKEEKIEPTGSKEFVANLLEDDDLR